MTPEQRIEALRAGEKAAAFYEEYPFEAARQQIIQEWARTKELPDRDALWFELQALDRIVRILRAAGKNAQVAALEIKAEQQTGQVDPYAHA